MPITSVTKDIENLTMTVIADFAVPLRRLWDAYVDPRQLSRFWGPPSYPSTFTRHDAFVGGRSDYFMTGPEGDTHKGYWEWIDVKAPEDGSVASFEVKDGFALEDCTPNPDLPNMRMVFQFSATDAGSQSVVTTYFDSADQLQQLLEMGMEEGMREAMGQMDVVLADLRSFAHGVATGLDILSDTQTRISRVVRGSVEQVWRAHTEPALMKQWLLGPDGWVMTQCDFPVTAGAPYYFAWAKSDGSEAFGFGGEILTVEEPHRLVTVERMFGDDGPSTVQDVTLTALESGTLITQVHTFESVEARDQTLGSGMVDGIESTYARLDSLLTV